MEFLFSVQNLYPFLVQIVDVKNGIRKCNCACVSVYKDNEYGFKGYGSII